MLPPLQRHKTDNKGEWDKARWKLPHKYKVLLFLFLLVLWLPSGEGGGYVNIANFLLDSRHILNYWATFYFRLTNKETLHPTPLHIALGHLMFPPSQWLNPDTGGQGWQAGKQFGVLSFPPSLHDFSSFFFSSSSLSFSFSLLSFLPLSLLSIFLFVFLFLLISLSLSFNLHWPKHKDNNNKYHLESDIFPLCSLKKKTTAFCFPYIKINGKHFANVKCYIKGKYMKDSGHINNNANDKFYLS